MLPLSQIAALRATVDEHWRSPVADAVAAAWGYPPGSAHFWRSSARHVFVVDGADDATPEAFLRFVPADRVRREGVQSVAVLMDRLATEVGGCVRVLPSLSDELVETVPTASGAMHAMTVAPALGEAWEVDDLGPDQARAWGAALGAVHRDGSPVAEGLALPDGRAQAQTALVDLEGDPTVAAAVHAVRARIGSLPRPSDRYGLIHGDFELDNLAWADGHPTAFDWDEAEHSWFAADIAYAVRDLVPDHLALIAGPITLLDDFLDGYHRARPQANVDRAQIVLFTALNALRSLARLRPVLAEDPETGLGLAPPATPGTAAQPTLRSRLERYADGQRRIAADLAPLI
jgi:Ser/Thr protein kinase RdoA (MazF antagonist)